MRENKGRTASDHKKIERKEYGIFRITKDHIEFEAIETDCKLEGPNGSKDLKDSLKLGKVIKDMFTQLIAELDVARQLQVFGILNEGN
nr:582_t:CDS:2 [Entrophospora candida]